MRSFSGFLTFILVFALSETSFAAESPSRPNVILIVCDNLGYGDIGCYGSRVNRTPNLDRMAKEGLRLTSFYVSSGVCTPSRASFMTGCYPIRLDMHVSDRGGLVLQPVAKKGLNPHELTIAEVFKQAHYKTAMIGKWHLGDQLEFLPTRQGFDQFFGIPYSDDMTPRKGFPWPPLPLMRNEQVIESGVDRNDLTKRYTEEAIKFITENKEHPFFLYLPQAMPGSTPHPFASVEFRGRSRNGAWGDSVEELDWSTGEILATLKRKGLDQNTLVVWTSDNGAPRHNPQQGSNAPLAGWGYDVSEGAMRVPCLVRWPGHVPVGVTSDLLCTSMDLFPTFAKLAGIELPPELEIDGRDITPIFQNPAKAQSPHAAFFYYFSDQLQAVRSGPWKLYLPLTNRRVAGNRRIEQPAALFNLVDDLQETRNVAGEHPEVVQQLLAAADRARQELGDEDRPSPHQRRAGWVEHPTPRLP